MDNVGWGTTTLIGTHASMHGQGRPRTRTHPPQDGAPGAACVCAPVFLCRPEPHLAPAAKRGRGSCCCVASTPPNTILSSQHTICSKGPNWAPAATKWGRWGLGAVPSALHGCLIHACLLCFMHALCAAWVPQTCMPLMFHACLVHCMGASNMHASYVSCMPRRCA